MKKGKIFKTLAVVGTCMCAPFVLSGCDKEVESKVSFRVEDGYIQVTEDGTNWKDLIDVDDLKGLPGQEGIAGKQVEFQATKTHIQWRYVGEENWNDLIAFVDLEQKEDEVDVEALNQRGFTLFTSKLNNMNGNYKVTYDYADKYIVESFGNFSFLEYVDATSAQNLVIRASLEYDYGGKSKPVGSEEWYTHYSFNGIAEITGDYVPTNHLTHMYTYQQDIEEYKYFAGGGTVNYLPNSADENFNFNYVRYLKSFTADDIIDCEFNDNGDCIIIFNYYGGNGYSSSQPYLKSDYTYEFNVNKDGEIQRCYVYEKDFLNPDIKGDLYCKISYEKGKSLITNDMFEDLLEKVKEKNPKITSLVDYFAFTKVEE